MKFVAVRRFVRKAKELRSRIRKFVAMERARSPEPFKAPRLLAKGFFSQRKILYGFERYKRTCYISDWEIEFNLGGINDPIAKQVLANKLYFHLSLPREYNKHFIGFINRNCFKSFSTFESMDSALERFGRIFVKPADGRSGNGIRVFGTSEFEVNGPHVVEEPIIAHQYSSGIYPESINSIRIITLRDNNGGFIAGAAHRFGSRMTGFIDNFSKGGIAAYIDSDSGVMATGRSNPGVYPTSFHKTHPDTGEPIEGVCVPYWSEVKDLALKLSELFSDLFYVGWDIAVTPDGPVVIEGNSGVANPNLIQAHKPLLTSERVTSFFEAHGVISKRHAKQCRAAFRTYGRTKK